MATGEANDKPYMDYGIIGDYFMRTQPVMVHESLDVFEDEIGYDGRSLTDDEQQDLSSFSLEWFIFDHRLPNGQTPLTRYPMLPGVKLSRKQVKDLQEAADTQFVGTFWVLSASAADHVVRLEDAATGKRYDVSDDSASQSLDGIEGGLLTARLVCVRGVWYFPGNLISFRRIKPTARLKEMLRTMHADNDMTFADYVSIEMGFDDLDGVDDVDGISGVEQEHPWEVLERYRTMSTEERADELERLHEQYDQLRSRCTLPYTWEGLCDLIGSEGTADDPTVAARAANPDSDDSDDDDRNAATDMLDLIKLVMPAEPDESAELGELDDESESETDDDAEYLRHSGIGELIEIFMRTWNLVPHRILNGKSPSEVNPSDDYDGLFD